MNVAQVVELLPNIKTQKRKCHTHTHTRVHVRTHDLALKRKPSFYTPLCV
jgi:hypothetical protein